MKRILIVAAHPDDEVLGCGGLLALESQAGAECHVAVLTNGCTGRYNGSMPAKLQEHAWAAGQILGVTALHFREFPNQALETVPLTEIAQSLEHLIAEIIPTAVYTHHGGDLNLDHRIVHEATLVACRPLPGQVVRELYSYNVPSSTEWASPDGEQFAPNVLLDISGTIDKKTSAMRCYASECRSYPHPRSPESLEAHARYWGLTAGMEFAEPFRLIRCLR